ncbi:Uncharacterised protein [Escherichia coli]|uniref:Uncharacterized protein n=1 Tax=Escherichia coli TaxID=562 RepID=A0A376U1H7_ECOLX|nr:Uncharacterised protein [Escherichia coli]
MEMLKIAPSNTKGVGRIRWRKYRIRHYAALEFDNSAGCGASALSGLRFNASKNGELPGLSVRGWLDKPCFQIFIRLMSLIN